MLHETNLVYLRSLVCQYRLPVLRIACGHVFFIKSSLGYYRPLLVRIAIRTQRRRLKKAGTSRSAQVPGRRLRGLYPRRPVRGRDSRRHLRGIAKEGTTLAGLMNSFMISVSLGLQYGVPLEVYVSKFAHMRFEPSGNDERRRHPNRKSIVDYIFRWMGKKFLTAEQQEEIGILSPEVRARLAQRYAGGAAAARGGREAPPRARPPCSTPGRTPWSAPSAAGGWFARAPCTRAGTAGQTPAVRSKASRPTVIRFRAR